MKRMPKNHVGIIIGLTLAMILALFGCMGQNVRADKPLPALTVSGSGVPGKPMDVNGTGFAPGEVIELVLNMEDVPIIVGKKGKVIKAGPDGAFAATTNYPHKFVAIAGVWDLVATGDKGSEAICRVEIKSPDPQYNQ